MDGPPGERLRQGLRQLGLHVGAESQRQLLWYLDELLRWNRRINLTAVRDAEEAVEKHLLDSLTLLPHLPERAVLLDLGSGAGLPGLILKIARRELALVSVDAVAKKIHFQRHVIRELGLQGAEALAVRAEELAADPAHCGRYDLVTCRAVAELPELARLARPFLALHGRLAAMKGPGGAEEAAGWREDETGLRISAVETLRLPFTASERSLIFLSRNH